MSGYGFSRQRCFHGGCDVPSAIGDQPGKTTPEELLAASHAVCFGIGLRSLIGRRGGRARAISVTATITAEKGPQGILMKSSHLSASVERLEGMDAAQLEQVGSETKERCTISIAIGGAVAVTHHVVSVSKPLVAGGDQRAGGSKRTERHQRVRFPSVLPKSTAISEGLFKYTVAPQLRGEAALHSRGET